MRDTGPISKNIDSNGDEDAAARQLGHARTQLGILKNQMALGGLAAGSRTVRLPDGTVIQAVVAAGISRVNVSVPNPESPAEELPTSETPVPRPPEPPQPPQLYGFALYGGEFGSSLLDQLVRPFEFDGAVFTDASESPHILGQTLIYDFPDNALNSLLMLGVVNLNTGAPETSEPVIKAKFQSGEDVPTSTFILGVAPVQLTSPKNVRLSLPIYGGTEIKPGGVNTMLVAPAWEPAPIRMTATTGDGHTVQGDLTIAGGANPGVVLPFNPIATIFTINGVSAGAIFLPCPGRTCTVVVQFNTLDPSFSYEMDGTFCILYPNNRPSASGGQQAGVWKSWAWQGSGPITFIDASGQVDFSVVATGYGTTAVSGALVLTDGYGVVANFAIDITITIAT